MNIVQRIVVGAVVSLVAATTLSARSSAAGAQAVSPLPDPTGRAVAAPLSAAAAAPSIAGRVQQYLLTPHGEVDGLLLADGTVVKSPPHLGPMLASIAKPGDGVSVVGFFGPVTSYGRAIKALAITNTATGRTVVDQPPAERPLPPHVRGLVRAPLTVSGPVAHVLVNPKGDVDGLVLAGGEQVKLKPKTGALVLTQLGQGVGVIAASGYGTQNGFGTVLRPSPSRSAVKRSRSGGAAADHSLRLTMHSERNAIMRTN